MSKKEKSKGIIGKIFGWIFGIIFGMVGFGSLVSVQIIPALISLLIMAILIPPLSNLIKEKMNLNLSTWIKIIIIFVGLILIAITTNTDSTTDNIIENQNNTNTINNEEIIESDGVLNTTQSKESNIPKEQNNEISEYQKVLESYKELAEQKSEITSKYLDKDGYYSYYDLTLDELNNLKQIETSIKEQLSAYKNSISEKDKNYEFISESLQSSEESLTKINDVLDTVGTISNIEAYATLDSWDADTDFDGVNVNLRIFSTPYEYVRAKGLLKVSIYHAVGFLDDQKGEIIESFTKELDINDFTTGTCGNEEKYCGFIREIRFDFTKPNNLGGLNFGYMEVTFETQGKSFEAIDETFNEN
jgi:hypothetical protein